MNGRHLRAAVGVSLALAGPVAPAGAQSAGLDVAAGIAIPRGSFGAWRGPGPLVQVGVAQRGPGRSFRLRGQLEAAWIPGSGPSTLGGWRTGDALLLTGLGGFTAGSGDSSAAPYFLLAVGVHWMSVEAARNPYGTVLGARVGAGLRWRIRGLQMRVESAPHAILSDYGSEEFSPGVYWVTMAGLTF